MAHVELVRISTSKQETQRQHDDLDSICVRVFEEKILHGIAAGEHTERSLILDLALALVFRA